MKRVVVTGATGFVGANLVRRLLRDGHEVHILVRPEYDPWRIDDIRGDLTVHVAALEDAEGVATALDRARAEWLFNLAAHGAYSWQSDVRAMVATNLLGTINLLEAALRKDFESFIHTGSSSEYGWSDVPPSESAILNPNSHYAVTKASATLYCTYAARSQQLPVRTLRLYSVYGPWEEPRRLVPTVALRGLSGKLPPLVDPDIARDYIFVDDAVEAYVLAASTSTQEPGVVYNVATGRQTSLREIVAIARHQLSLSEEPVWGSMPNRSWDTTIWVGNPEKIASVLGWRAQTDVHEGFHRTLAWLRDTPGIRRLYERRSAASGDFRAK